MSFSFHPSVVGPNIYAEIFNEVRNALALHAPDVTLVAGDWNAHPIAPRDAFDRALSRTFRDFSNSGFLRFPETADRPTYRSANSITVIDFALVLGSQATCRVDSVFIAQHRPIAGKFEVSSHPLISVSKHFRFFKSSVVMQDSIMFVSSSSSFRLRFGSGNLRAVVL